MLDYDRIGRPYINTGTLVYAVVLGIHCDGGFAFHQVDQLVRVFVGPDFEFFTGVQPAQGANDIFGAAELIVQNFGNFSRARNLGVWNFICVDKSQ